MPQIKELFMVEAVKVIPMAVVEAVVAGEAALIQMAAS